MIDIYIIWIWNIDTSFTGEQYLTLPQNDSTITKESFNNHQNTNLVSSQRCSCIFRS